MFFQVKYGASVSIRFPMVKRSVVDLAGTADWTPATGDTKISKDGGNFANTTNNPAAVGGSGSVGWTLTLTGAETTAAEIQIQIVDSATKAVEDQFLIIYTYGHVNAKIPFNFDAPLVPKVMEVTATSFASDATAHLVSMPAAVETGDLLICLFANDGNATVTLPSGWTQKDTGAISTLLRLGVYAKEAVGTEGGTTVDFVTSAAERAAAQVYRIKRGDWYGDLTYVTVGTSAQGTSVSPNPPTNAPSWKAIDTLFIAVAANQDGTHTTTAYPTNYVDGVSTVSDASATGVNLASATNSIRSVSEDPGVFTISTSDDWLTQTIAVRSIRALAIGDFPANFNLQDIDSTGGVNVTQIDSIPTTGRNAISSTTLGTITLEETLTLPSGYNQVHAQLFLRGKLYAAHSVTSPSVMFRFNTPQTNLASALTTQAFANDTFHVSAVDMCYSPLNDKIYVLFSNGTTRTVVDEVDPYTLAVTNVINDTADKCESGAITTVGNSLYVVTNQSPSKIIRYALSDFSRTSSTTLSKAFGHAAQNDGTYVYVSAGGSGADPAWVAKLNPADMSVVEADLGASVHTVPDDFAVLDGGLWFGMEAGTNIGAVYRVSTDDLTDQKLIKTGVSSQVYSVNRAMGYVWVVWGSSPGKLGRINPMTMDVEEVTTLTENLANELSCDGNFIYLFYYLQPSKVSRHRYIGIQNTLDTYQAKVTLVDDNGGTTDRYTVSWFKNGGLMTSNLTSAKIRVYKIADGADLVASTTMTEIGFSQSFRYTEATNRVVSGVGYEALVSVVIDGIRRYWKQPIGRDT